MVLFSIIIPVYSVKYLDTCINSILMQSFNDFEVICIDFQIENSSSEILKKYEDSYEQFKVLNNSKLFIRNENEDYSKFNNYDINLNYCLDFIKGDYVIFVDCNDWLDLNSLEIFKDYLDKNDLDLLVFNKLNFDENYLFDDLNSFFGINNISNNVLSIDKLSFEFISHIIKLPFNYLYKSTFLRENNSFLDNLYHNLPIFNLELIFKANLIGLIDLYLYNNRINVDKPSNIQLNISDYFLNFISEIEKINLEKRDIFYNSFRTRILNFVNYEKIFLKFLDAKSSLIYNLIKGYDQYLDFITDYSTSTVEYLKVIDSKKDNYKLSVIVPIYNTGEILNRTLTSLLNQTLEDIEVIMVNDFSNDDLTNKIAEDYAIKNDNFKLIYLNDNHGSAGIPRNIGIKESKSDYIMFLDHEDYYEPDSCEFLYNDILSKNCDLVFGNYNVIKNGVATPYYDPDVNPGFYDNVGENLLFYHSPGASIWTKIFKRDLLIQNNILFIPILGEDWAFLFKYFEVANGIHYCYDKIVYNYDLRDISTTTNVSLNYFIEGFVGEKYIYDFFMKKNNLDYFKFRVYIFNYFLTLFGNSTLNKHEIKRLQPLLYNHYNIFESLGMVDWDFTKKELFDVISENNYSSLIGYFPHFKRRTILYITILDKSNNLPLVDNLNRLLIDFNVFALTYEDFKIKIWDCNLNNFNLIDEIGYSDKIVNFSQLNNFYQLIFNKFKFEKIFFRHFASFELMIPFRSLVQAQRILPLSFASENNIPTIYGENSDYLLDNADFNYYSSVNIDPNTEKGVIYTAIFGDYESLLNPKVIDENLDYICFTDNPNLKSDVWKIKLIPNFVDDFYNFNSEISFTDLDYTRRARTIKCLPHIFLKEYDFSIWIDAGFLIVGDVIEYVNRYSKKDFLGIKHSVRQCLYDEADEVLRLKLDDEERILKQMSKYKNEHYPKNNGLIESGILFRRHDNEQIRSTMEDWFKEIINFSKRDQLSFNYVAWKNALDFDLASIYYTRNPYFHHYYHIKSIIDNKVLLNQFRVILVGNNLDDIQVTIDSINEINDFIPVSIITNNNYFVDNFNCPYNVEILICENEVDFVDSVISDKHEENIHVMKAGEILDYEVILNYFKS